MLNSLFRATSRLASTRSLQANRIITAMPSNQLLIHKNWAHNIPVTYDFIRERIMLILHLFDKIDPNKLTLDSHFYHDLGLNSLDHVEIIMMMEDEFLFEIPDKDAEQLLTPKDFLRYLSDKEEAYEELQELHAHHGHRDHGDHHEDNHVDSKHEDESHSHSQGASHSGDTKHLGNHQQHRAFSTLTAIRYAKETWPTSFREPPPAQVKVEEIQERVMKVCSRYDKIDSSKLTIGSHFVDDLGLDSLDHIEIIMELEDEFGLEIPDTEADKLMRPGEVVKYIAKREEERAQTFDERPY